MKRLAITRVRSVLGAGIALSLNACTTGQVAVTPKVTVADISTSKLQFAAGTATIGTNTDPNTGLPYVKGLNFVATFRAPNGNNPATYDTPTLTAPSGLDFGFGSKNLLAGALPATLIGIPASGLPATIIADQASGKTPFGYPFGFQTGIFGFGLATNAGLPPNLAQSVSTSCSGFTPSYEPVVPLPQLENNCLFANGLSSDGPVVAGAFAADTELPFSYLGGPPAWPEPLGYNNFPTANSTTSFPGYSIGFFDFATQPVPGTYSLDVAVPSSADFSTYSHFDASTNLSAARSAAFLPLFSQPTLTLNGDGSGTINVVVPSGAIEAIVYVNASSCDISNAQRVTDNYYSIITHTPGAQTLFLSGQLGAQNASGERTHTFCTNSDLQAANAITVAAGGAPLPSYQQNINIGAVGFDYPAFEAAYPQNTSQTPKIVNAQGTADLTASHPFQIINTVTAP